MRIRSTPSKGTIVMLSFPARDRLPKPGDYRWGASVELHTMEKSALRH
jgi:hypothetical protein